MPSIWEDAQLIGDKNIEQGQISIDSKRHQEPENRLRELNRRHCDYCQGALGAGLKPRDTFSTFVLLIAGGGDYRRAVERKYSRYDIN